MKIVHGVFMRVDSDIQGDDFDKEEHLMKPDVEESHHFQSGWSGNKKE